MLAAKRAVRVAHDRGGGDHDVGWDVRGPSGPGRDLLRHGRDPRVEVRVRGGHRLGALGVTVEQRHAREPGEDLLRQLEVRVALAAAADEPDRLHRPLGESADPEHARRRGADLGDPGGVHDRERRAAGRVREHEQPVDVRERRAPGCPGSRPPT